MDWEPREATDDDIRQVLTAHGLPSDDQAVAAVWQSTGAEWSIDLPDVVYSYAYECSPDEQTPVVLYATEGLLRDWGIVPPDAPQKFPLG